MHISAEMFDAITTGFTIRNVSDIVGAFREMWRIARPHAERVEATRAMRARLAGPRHRPALARCEAVHEELLQVC